MMVGENPSTRHKSGNQADQAKSKQIFVVVAYLVHLDIDQIGPNWIYV